MLATKLVLLALVAVAVTPSQCVDENGAAVDWFVALREPNSRRYLFFDSYSTAFRPLPDETFLKNLFQNVDVLKDQLTLWNDEPAQVPWPGTPVKFRGAGLKAHDKGVLYKSAGDGQGFYLLHSVPKFPDISGGALDPKTPVGSIYGQSMMCVSISSPVTYLTIWNHLSAQKSNVYFNSFPFPEPPETTVQVVDSFIEGRLLRLVTKTIKNPNAPYEGMLAPLFKTGWLVESWGRRYAENTYAPYRVINNEGVNFPSGSYKSTQDHSKYALSFGSRGLLCIGGLNHMDSQEKRGGSFVCLTHLSLYDQFWNWIMNPPRGPALKRFKKSHPRMLNQKAR